MRGENCRYSHEKAAPQVSSFMWRPSEAKTPSSKQDPRSQISCYHYARGHCRNGSNCPYSHIVEKEQKAEPELDPEVCFSML